MVNRGKSFRPVATTHAGYSSPETNPGLPCTTALYIYIATDASHRALCIHCTSSPCSFSAAFSSAVPTPTLTPDSGWRSGGRKQGVAPLRTSACTADLCASRGRITTLLRPLPLPAGASARGAPPGRELCHCTQAMIDARTPHVLFFPPHYNVSPLRREEAEAREATRGGVFRWGV